MTQRVESSQVTTPIPSRWARRAETILLVLSLALAGLVASFAARNSDVWQHLASGRIIANRQYDFTSDPLSYSTEGQRWVNHSWLTDWLAYQVFRQFEGQGLVPAKAFIVLFAVGIGVLRLRRDRPRWPALLFAVAAIVAWSPRATLQPMILSCGLLALVLDCLQRGGKAHRLVPFLIALWVNLDEWYILGPIATALYWLGHRWKRDAAVPLWLPLSALGACLVSPFHIFGLTLPTELSPAFWMSDLARDPRLWAQFGSYFTPRLFSGEGLDNTAFWSYCSIVIGGTLALFIRRKLENPWVGMTWAFVVALSIWQSRLVPFCAVVAISLVAPQLQSLTPAKSWGRLGRWATLVILLGCAILTWSGWLQGSRGRDRALGWSVYADPSLVRAAETLSTWRKDGSLPPELHILGSSPDVSNTMMWFANGERGALDTRWDLHARAGRIHSLDPFEAKDRFLQDRVAAILLFDPAIPALEPVVEPNSPWRILRLDGRAVWLAGKNETILAPWPTAEKLAFKPEPLAFSDSSEPIIRPKRYPKFQEWWMTSTAQRPTSGATTFLNLQLASKNRSPALPILAIRAARAAIAANPDDAEAWIELAKAYAVLGNTAEREIGIQSGCFVELRRVQRMTALMQAVVANPESEAARDGLAATLTEVGYLDRALVERREQLELVRRRGDRDLATALGEVIAKLEDDAFDRECLFQIQTQKMSGDPLGRARIALGLGLAQLAQDTLLKSSFDLYGNDGLRLLAGILIATGQAQEAQTLLDRDELKQNPARLGLHEIPLQAFNGQRLMRLPAYDWYRFLLAASVGIADVREPLDRIQSFLIGQLEGVEVLLNRSAVQLSFQIVAEAGLGSADPMLPRVIIGLQRDQLLRPVRDSRLFLRLERAELAVLEGWCDLEAGDATRAKAQFDAALTDYERAAELKLTPAKPIAELYRGKLAEFAK